MHPFPAPMPDTTLLIRRDLAEELGALQALRARLQITDPTNPIFAKIDLLRPPAATHELCVAIAAWAELPERVFFREFIFPGQTSPALSLGIVFRPDIPLLVEIPIKSSELWPSTVAMIRRKTGFPENELFPFQLPPLPSPSIKGQVAPSVLLLERSTGKAIVLTRVEAQNYLARGLAWNTAATA